MRCDLNDWLLEEPDERQYWLVGFGVGFTEAVMTLCRGYCNDQASCTVKISGASGDIRASIDWLGRLQVSGTDNAGPSTGNLHDALQAAYQHMSTAGPVKSKYWNEGRNDAAAASALAAGTKALIAQRLEESRRIGLGLKMSMNKPGVGDNAFRFRNALLLLAAGVVLATALSSIRERSERRRTEQALQRLNALLDYADLDQRRPRSEREHARSARNRRSGDPNNAGESERQGVQK